MLVGVFTEIMEFMKQANTENEHSGKSAAGGTPEPSLLQVLLYSGQLQDIYLKNRFSS